MIGHTFARAALFAAIVLSTVVPVAAAEVTSLPGGAKLVVERPDAAPPKGVVLLIPGGSTTLTLGDGGKTSSDNFVIRTRRSWLQAGFAIAYMDDPGDLREPLARLRAIARPVIVLATSRGTLVAARNAADLGAAGPDLLILTSPVTGSKTDPRSGGAESVTDANLRAVKIPTLVVTNDNDTCFVSTPDGAAGVVRRIGANATLMRVSSTAMTSAPCEALSPHGYLGIESDVLAKISGWIAIATKPQT